MREVCGPGPRPFSGEDAEEPAKLTMGEWALVALIVIIGVPLAILVMCSMAIPVFFEVLLFPNNLRMLIPTRSIWQGARRPAVILR